MAQKDNISAKRLKFIAEYLKDNNATQAAIRAGYSARTSRTTSARLMADVNIKAEVDRRRAAIAKKDDIDAAWVLRELLANVERCKHDDDHGNCNRALELISRHTGGFDPKQKIEHSGFIETAEQQELEAYLRGQGIDPDDIQERILQ